MTTIRAVIADDHELVRKGLVAMLRGSEIEIVAEASNRDEAVERTLEHRPDVVVMDIRMPNHDDGLEALRPSGAAFRMRRRHVVFVRQSDVHRSQRGPRRANYVSASR